MVIMVYTLQSTHIAFVMVNNLINTLEIKYFIPIPMCMLQKYNCLRTKFLQMRIKLYLVNTELKLKIFQKEIPASHQCTIPDKKSTCFVLDKKVNYSVIKHF